MSIQFVKNTQDFDAYLASNTVVIANFTALWCGPCQQIKPLVDQLYADPKFAGVEVVRVDLDSQQELAARHHISSVPTFVVFEEGKEVEQLRGANALALPKLFEKYAKGTSRNGNGAKKEVSPLVKEVAGLIPKGFEVLNDSIYFGQFEALNTIPLHKHADAHVSNVFRVNVAKEESTVLSDADSQLLFYVPLTHISKVYSILVAFRKGESIKGDLELDEDELTETQTPSVVKVWVNDNAIKSFDEVDEPAPHVEKVEADDSTWYEIKLKYVRFQNVQALNIFIDGPDEDYHTLVDKIVLVGVSGESKEQAKINLDE